MHFRVFGIWISNASGNTFAPAIQINRGLIIRTVFNRETRFWWKDGIRWNSDHIAIKWGRLIGGDEYLGYPDAYQYKGILGEHTHV